MEELGWLWELIGNNIHSEGLSGMARLENNVLGYDSSVVLCGCGSRTGVNRVRSHTGMGNSAFQSFSPFTDNNKAWYL